MYEEAKKKWKRIWISNCCLLISNEREPNENRRRWMNKRFSLSFLPLVVQFYPKIKGVSLMLRYRRSRNSSTLSLFSHKMSLNSLKFKFYATSYLLLFAISEYFWMIFLNLKKFDEPFSVILTCTNIQSLSFVAYKIFTQQHLYKIFKENS